MNLRAILGFRAILTIPSAAAAFSSLTDVSSSPNIDAINYLVENGVLTGYPDGTFRPKNVVRSGESLKVLVATVAPDTELTGSAACFPGVGEEWFTRYDCFAKQQGWVNGYADCSFRPKEQVNRAESVKVLVNSQGYKLPADDSTVLYPNVDSSDGVAPYVKAGHQRNLAKQTSGQMNPSARMTRFDRRLLENRCLEEMNYSLANEIKPISTVCTLQHETSRWR